jgi:ATP-dependent helicase/nuclease subunit B
MIKTKHDLFTHMLHGATIITPNNRLSNQLLNDFYYQQGTTVKNKPFCLPYHTALVNLFHKIRYQYPNAQHPFLLNSEQLRSLWSDIISNQDQYPCNDGLLNTIQAASTQCLQWEIDSNDTAFSQTLQTRQFQQWQQVLLNRLVTLNAITEEQLVQYIKYFPTVLQLKTVIWVCFDEYTPQQRSLQQAFTNSGCAQYFYDLSTDKTEPPITTRAHRYTACDIQDEKMQMMLWIKTRLAAGDTRIAVLVPELQAQHSSLQRFFQRYFSAETFHFSQAKSLNDYPLASHAITCLSLDKKIISNPDARLLLHSPFLDGAQTEFIARAAILQSSPCLQEANILFNQFVAELHATAPKLAQLLTMSNDYPEQDTPQAWIEHFKNRLHIMGFPGESPLNSSSYQCFQRLMEAFDQLLQLSLVKPVLTAQQALATLQNLVKNTVIQEPKLPAPIEIMGLTEASGCEFDSIWVMGLTDLCLPKKTMLSAFIPLNIQQNSLMPRASAARELQLAKQLLQRLQNGSRQCVFSYPRLALDMPNMPSPLLGELCEWPPITSIFHEKNSKISNLVSFEDAYSLPLSEAETASGGTSLLANQAKCPFRAFAAHRLHLKSELKISTGLNAGERGQIVHRVMELLWRDLKNQQQLNALSTNELEQRIESAICNALTPVIQNRPVSFPPLVQSVEKICLNRLVNACLDWEKQRPAFAVNAVEQTYSIELAGLDFRVRVDRLDELESGSKWVIDYKTSLPPNKPWKEERPEAPQLLLYALLDDTINVLLFMQLKAGRLACSGLSEDTIALQGLSALKKNEHWSDYQQKWHQQLTTLASEFKEGLCSPNPTRVSTCDFCEFQNLCRRAS